MLSVYVITIIVWIESTYGSRFLHFNKYLSNTFYVFFCWIFKRWPVIGFSWVPNMPTLLKQSYKIQCLLSKDIMMLSYVFITCFEVLSIKAHFSSVQLVFVLTSWADITACSRVATCVHISPRLEDPWAASVMLVRKKCLSSFLYWL